MFHLSVILAYEKENHEEIISISFHRIIPSNNVEDKQKLIARETSSSTHKVFLAVNIVIYINM